jgi:hypothetical protein
MSIESRCLVSLNINALNINAREQNVLDDILYYTLMCHQRNTCKS